MSCCRPGDVVLVPFPFAGESGAKLRPALVVAIDQHGDPVCCPIRSALRAGTGCIPIGIQDFASGGLDLFSVSFVQTDTLRAIRSRAVAGRKGRVTGEFLAEVTALIRP